MQKFNHAASLALVIGLTGCATTAPEQAPVAPQPATAAPAPPVEKPTPPAEWGPAFATAGTKLELESRGSTTVAGRPAMSVGFVASGYPKDRTYLLWLRMLTGRMVMLDKLQVDAAGNLITEQGIELGKQTFNLYSLHRGEPVDFALISQDQVVRAFARVVPFPLEARHNACSLTMELLALDGRQFGVKAEGFTPNEEVVTTSTIASQTKQQKLKASEQGRFVAILDATQIQQQGGSATYQATGKHCKPRLTYDWGTALKKL